MHDAPLSLLPSLTCPSSLPHLRDNPHQVEHKSLDLTVTSMTPVPGFLRITKVKLVVKAALRHLRTLLDGRERSLTMITVGGVCGGGGVCVCVVVRAGVRVHALFCCAPSMWGAVSVGDSRGETERESV